MQRTLVSGLVCAAVSLATFVACNQPASQSANSARSATSQDTAGNGSLSLTMPVLAGVVAGSTMQFVLTPTSGATPITVNQAYAAGNIATVAGVPSGSYTLQINVLDANNNVDWTGSTPVTVAASITTPATVTLAPSAGGTGSVAVTLQVGTATTGIAPTVTFNGNFPSMPVYSSVTLSAGGSHVAAACTAPAQLIGTFADCTGGTCSGTQVVCGTWDDISTAAATDPIVTSVVLTPSANGCPSGSVLAGTLTDGAAGAIDVGSGTAGAIMNLCVTSTALSSLADGSPVVTALALTTESSYTAPGACIAPATGVGASADCTSGICTGDLVLCQTTGLTP